VTDTVESARLLIETVADCLDAIDVRGVLIGGQAVNAWVEPRITLDVDVTVMSGPSSHQLLAQFEQAGFGLLQKQDAGGKSGPDFLRMRHAASGVALDVQVAKTDFETGVVTRGVVVDGLRIAVATPEDLLLLKLIASRHKDQRDLIDLGRIASLDWPYIEHWAPIWDISERLADLRALLARPE
jgi:hypothetical protein